MTKTEIPPDEREMIQSLKRGESVVFKIPGRGRTGHRHVYEWAKKNNLYIRIHRHPIFGNPHETRQKDKVMALFLYAFTSVFNEDLTKNLPTLRGKALGCVCRPACCHGGVLIELLKEFESK